MQFYGNMCHGIYYLDAVLLFRFVVVIYLPFLQPLRYSLIIGKGFAHGDNGDVACDGYHKYKVISSLVFSLCQVMLNP